MIGYVTLGTNDLSKAKVFYDQLLATLGATRMMETERFVAWHTEPGKPGLGITRPSDGQAASVGNGVMVALEARKARLGLEKYPDFMPGISVIWMATS
jgi:predicted enzyme related to lactoylglutathione lyase